MSRAFIATALAGVAAAGALAWVGTSLLSLPHRTDGVARAIEGTSATESFDKALELFRSSVNRSTSSGAGLAQRAHAEAALAAQRGSPKLRSQAQTLLGVLALEDAIAAHKQARAVAALSAFRNALRLDPDNEPAAIDLELLLGSSQKHGSKKPPHGRARAKQGATGRRGRGATSGKSTGGGY